MLIGFAFFFYLHYSMHGNFDPIIDNRSGPTKDWNLVLPEENFEAKNKKTLRERFVLICSKESCMK